MNVNTENFQAFELYSLGLDTFRIYLGNKKQELLRDALTKFDQSVDLDPKFFLPRYYQAVVKDLMGDYEEASEVLESLKDTAPSDFKDLVFYSLAIALYHYYNPAKIEESIEIFESVKSRNPYVNLLARAGKIQSMAVHMMLSYREKSKAKKAIKDKKDIIKEGKEILKKLTALNWFSLKGRKQDTITHQKEIRWITYNAMGLAFMYVSDTVRYQDKLEKNKSIPENYLKELKKAREYFEKADKINSGHWAILSNKGSLNLRKTALEYYYEKDELWGTTLKETIIDFEKVLEVRPDYDFAYYELGKVNRMTERWEEAINHFNQALEVQEKGNVNVPKSSIERQIKLCKQQYAKFF
ncbi:hypothetical protein AB9K32_07770 [Allomuricauda sp. XS_ASV26]|uniref:tetratricopeptide repeat protein n=1 Tax=Allomuricauda sp. XS_ASV26 TaxID=3241292 RepID=UPI0035152D5B